MKHLEFVDELEKFGIGVKSINKESRIREYEVESLWKTKTILSQDFKLSWKEKEYSESEPIKKLLAKAVDLNSFSI